MAVDLSKLSGSSELSEVALEVRRLTEEARQKSIESVDPEALRWLAILPEWTESLARDCRFPPPGSDVAGLIDQVRAADLCQVFIESDLVGERTVRLWMESEVRAALFNQWNQQPDLHLDQEVKEIAERILNAHNAAKPVSLGILRWAQLAEAELAGGVVTGRSLEEKMDDSLGAGKISEAGEWLFAAEWLTKPLGAVMDFAASRARRQLSIHHLRQQDEEYVEWFLPRNRQMDELHRLARSTEQWGVHFIGLSGVGKTMLMRFVNSKHEGNPFASSSRVDFDYLDPSIPVERPARLLQELGEGFAVELATGAQRSLFQSFIDSVRTAEAAREAMGPEAGGQAAASEQFEQAVKAFALFLESLPQPVALVLDTCEELAKFEPPDGRTWSVDATFDILERVHSEMPELKLIVAGRRWVTSEYANIPPRQLPAPDSVTKAPGRPFVRFHPIRGFTAVEARDYLLDVRGVDLPEHLVESILESTVDNAEVPSDPDAERGAEEDVRYSPNDLAFCAKVLEEDPDAGLAAIKKGDFDQYLTNRIFARVNDVPGLGDVFPVAALLGHFDSAVIEPLLGNNEDQRRALLKRLAEEDWTHLEGGPELDKIVFKVDQGLLPRLQRYFGRTFGREAKREEKKRKLQTHLAAKLEAGPEEATVEVVDAAVRLLEPEVAIEKLDLAAKKAARSGSWSWAEAVSQRLLDQERKPKIDRSMRATIWALYLTAMKRGQSTIDLGPAWVGIAQIAEREPPSDRMSLLATRARLAALATTAVGRIDRKEVEGLLAAGRRLLGKLGSDSLASALLAAVEHLVDSGEEEGAAIPAKATGEAIGGLVKRFKGLLPGMRLHLLSLEGRLAVLSGDLDEATRRFTEVESLIRDVEEAAPSFADWEGPSSLAARATLELLRYRLAGGRADERFLVRCAEIAYEAPPGADSAQLLWLVFQARLAQGPPRGVDVKRAAELEARLKSYQPRAPAHRTAPPLFVSVALSWMACGQLRKGMELLDERERKAVAAGTEERATGAAALARMRILPAVQVEGGPRPYEPHGQWRRRGADRSARRGGADRRDPAAARSERGRRPRGVEVAQPADRGNSEAALAASGPADPVGGGFAEAHRLLDLIELEYVRQRLTGQRKRPRLDELEARLATLDLEHCRPSLCDPLGTGHARVAVRCRALLGDPPPSFGEERTAQFGQIALEEGELLGLRLPDRAADLLAVAVDCFELAGDKRGAFIASLRRAIAEIHAGKVGGAHAGGGRSTSDTRRSADGNRRSRR